MSVSPSELEPVESTSVVPESVSLPASEVEPDAVEVLPAPSVAVPDPAGSSSSVEGQPASRLAAAIQVQVRIEGIENRTLRKRDVGQHVWPVLSSVAPADPRAEHPNRLLEDL